MKNTATGDEYHELVKQASGNEDTGQSPRRAKGRGRPKKNPDTADQPVEPSETLSEPTELPESGIQPDAAAVYDYSVETPSGAIQPVLTLSEVEYYEDRRDRYTADHRFTSVTDLQDLDRVLSHEMILHRYDNWLTTGADYYGQAVSEKDLLRYVKDLSKTLMDLKKSMGLDKATRDKDQGADFVAWLDNVRKRAKQFNVKRNKEFVMSITLMHEIFAKIQLYLNTDDIEKKELGLFPEDVINWIWEDCKPRFDEIDEHFRKGGVDDDGNPYEGQAMWISEL